MQNDRLADALKWVFLAPILLVPVGVGYATGRSQGTGSWIIFGLAALALALFAWWGEGMRQATLSKGIDAYWHFVPILLLMVGRIAGTYAR